MRTPAFLSLLLLAGHAHAQSVHSIADGMWWDPTTWDCACVPSSTDSVVIGHDVTFQYDIWQAHVRVLPDGVLHTGANTAVWVHAPTLVEGVMHIDGSLLNPGPFTVKGHLEVIGTSGSEFEVQSPLILDSGSVEVVGQLDVHALLSGIGTICVTDSTWFYASVSGQVDICDLSPTTVTPPIVDYVYPGVVFDPSVTFCATSCQALGLSGEEEPTLDPYPNPVSGTLFIPIRAGGPITVDVFDLEGRPQRLSTHHQQNDIAIDMRPLTPGAYFLRLRMSEGGVEMKRVVVE